MGASELAKGTVINERFEVIDSLGSGGFGIAYLCLDGARGDHCVVKELFPPGSTRDPSGAVSLPAESLAALRLRQRFIEEAKIASRVVSSGVLPVRAAFQTNGTAYFATEYVRGATTLSEALAEEVVFEPGRARKLFVALLEALGAVHASGALHRDVKPSNILLADGKPYLIDFGAAREWEADRAQTHTILFTPQYAPPEQFAERARRGPATDLFSLCATVYQCLAGQPPVSAPERAAGTPYVPILDAAPQTPVELADAIDLGLRLRFAERPQSAASMLRTLAGEADREPLESLEAFDDRATRLKRFQPHRKQCPACLRGALDAPRPLKPLQCAVCHAGRVRLAKLDPRRCPNCRQAPLTQRQNEWPNAICPVCTSAVLEKRRSGLFSKTFVVACPECDSIFEPDGLNWRLVVARGKKLAEDRARSLSGEAWRAEAGRALEYWICVGCGAQFDGQADGRRRMMIPPGALKIDTYYPEEWTRIAAGLAPNAGNAECDSCGSDYFLEGSKITLLTYDRDPFGVAERLAGRLVDVETMRWLAVGKESPQPGRVCNECQAEFDLEGDRLRLVSCNNSRLLDRSSTAFSVEDWLRIGQDLPTVEEETQFEVDFDEALRNAYVGGQVGPDFPRRRDLIWAGPATLDDAPQGAFASDRAENRLRSGTLTLTTTEATFGGVFNRWKRTLDEIAGVSSEGDWIRLQFDGDAAVEFEVGALEMTCRLESGARKVNLTANDLMRRLRFEIDRAAVEV